MVCSSSIQCTSGPCKTRCCKADNPSCSECDDAGFCNVDAKKIEDGAVCTSSAECKFGPCKSRCCKADDSGCSECDSGGFCAVAVQSDGNEVIVVDESKCLRSGEEYNATTTECTPCPLGTTMAANARDVCEQCTDATTTYTLTGHVGSCTDLTIAEKTLARLVATGNSDPEKSKKGLDTGSIVGITLSLVIAGIGGVVMFLKGRKDDAKQNAILNQVAIGMGTMGKVQKSNPVYNDNSVGEDMYSDTEVTKCQSYKATGKDCAGTKITTAGRNKATSVTGSRWVAATLEEPRLDPSIIEQVEGILKPLRKIRFSQSLFKTGFFFCNLESIQRSAEPDLQ
jgi:hypothetical protein